MCACGLDATAEAYSQIENGIGSQDDVDGRARSGPGLRARRERLRLRIDR